MDLHTEEAVAFIKAQNKLSQPRCEQCGGAQMYLYGLPVFVEGKAVCEECFAKCEP